MNREKKKIDLLIKTLAIVGLLVIWTLYSRANPTVFPTPAATWNRFVRLLNKPVMSVSIWGHIGISLQRVMLALLAATVLGIEKYLGSGLIKGIGPKFAHRIVATFDKDTLDIIETDPDRLIEVPGIGKKRVERIKTN